MDDDRTETTAREAAPPPAEAEAASPKVPLRAAAGWALALVLTLTTAAVGAAGAVLLTVFGLGGAVLAVAAAVVAVGATLWRRALLPLTAVAVAIALPAAWAAQTDQRLDRSRGLLTVSPRVPADVATTTYRRGAGPVLVDLRRFNAPAGSTTRLAARADAGQLVVALPQDRCFHLDVRFRTDVLRGPASFALRAARLLSGGAGGDSSAGSSIGLTAAASRRTSEISGVAALRAHDAGQTTLPYDLLAFNRWASEAGRYRRLAAGQPDAPTLRLDLRSSQQLVIRDYPLDVGPLSLEQYVAGPHAQVSGTYWPEGVDAPLSPAQQGFAGRAELRTPANRARWIAWERRMVAWTKAQARRAAGPCATRADIADQGQTFVTQAERLQRGDRTERLLATGGARRSSLPQRTVGRAVDQLAVEVDGTGRARLVGDGVVRGVAADEAAASDATESQP